MILFGFVFVESWNFCLIGMCMYKLFLVSDFYGLTSVKLVFKSVICLFMGVVVRGNFAETKNSGYEKVLFDFGTNYNLCVVCLF